VAQRNQLACALGAPAVLWPKACPIWAKPRSADLSPQMERRIGESIMRDIRLREPSYIDDVEVAAYLNALGARLSAATPEAGQQLRVLRPARRHPERLRPAGRLHRRA
jgi:predicted Zn-dependent protease